MEQYGSQFWMRLKYKRCQHHLYSKMRCETSQAGFAKEVMRIVALSLSPTSSLKEVRKAERGERQGREFGRNWSSESPCYQERRVGCLPFHQAQGGGFHQDYLES